MIDKITGRLTKYKRPIFFIVSIIIIVFLIFWLLMRFSKPIAVSKAENGVLDLTGYDLSKTGVVKLDGEWEFYWGKLLGEKDYDRNIHPDAYVKVPGVWKDCSINNKKLSGTGFGTYRLRVKTSGDTKTLSMAVPTISSSYNLYIDGAKYASSGKVSSNSANAFPQYKPQIITFDASSGRFDIIIQVTNYAYSKGGLWKSLYIGKTEDIINKVKSENLKDAFLVGSLLILMLYYINMFFLRRDNLSSIYLVLACFVIMMRTLCSGSYIILDIFPNLSFKAIAFFDYMGFIWGPVAFTLLVSNLFPGESSKIIVRIFSVVASAETLFVLITPVRIFTGTVIYDYFIVLEMGYSLTVLFIALLRRRKNAAFLFAGSVILIFTIYHDVLYNNYIIAHNIGELSAYGLVIFLYFQSFVLAKRLAEAFSRSELYSKKLEGIDRIKDEFLAATSHELRTPLNGIISIVESFIKQSQPYLDDGQSQNLSLAVATGRRLTNIVNDMLDFVKIKYRDVRFVRKKVNVGDVVDSVISVHRYINTASNNIFINEIKEELFAYADVQRLEQILHNLIGNAAKFTNNGEIIVSAELKDDMIEITVKDNGIGIQKDKIKYLFESFEQMNDPEVNEYQGTGIGLSITRQLVEMHGGRIWAGSEYGKGSAFTFSLPACRDEDIEEAETDEFYQADSGENRLKIPAVIKQNDSDFILVVDDEYVNLVSIIDILKYEGYSIIAVSSGREALERIDGPGSFSLVVLDVLMPGMSGFEVCSKIREKYSAIELPVLMLTAKDNIQDKVSAFKEGANDFVSKPFYRDELAARVKTLVELKKSVKAHVNAEMTFLRAQIKPHFLYNVMSVIASLINRSPQKAKNCLLDLSDYLRASFSFDDSSELIPIKEELKLVELYLKLEKARFKKRLNIIMDTDGSIDINVPILVIQPLVENAVKHGILEKPEGGTVEISVKQEYDGFILISVCDNGVGIPEEKLDILMKGYGSNSIGISNINRRLKKMYNEELKIKSAPGRGTSVEFKIPADSVSDRGQNIC